jgi:Protein of unknown function (DUF1573)
MKKVTLLALLIGGFGLFSTNSIAQDAAQIGAKIEFDKEVHDYGELENGANGTCTFTFKNSGTAPLIITDAKKTCGCTVPSWPKEPIAPGASATITVKYDTKRPGNFNKNVTIYSNAVNTPEKIIKIKGLIKPKPAAGIPLNKVAPATK